jgi:DNA ligase-1
VKLATLVQTSNLVASSSRRLEKTSRLAEFVRQLTPEEVAIAVGFFIGWPRQGRLGVGWASVADASASEPAMVPSLELLEVDRSFHSLQAVKGKGSRVRRQTSSDSSRRSWSARSGRGRSRA